MPKRNLLYLYSNPADKHVVCHGVDFKGFLGAFEKSPDNLLLVKHDNDGKTYNSHSGFSYVGGGEIDKLNISKRGDLCCLDFKDEFVLDQLTRLDIAELLYFGHKRKPFSSPVFTRLQNRFAYWSHDDGWFTSVYFTDSGDMQSFISAAITAVAQTKHRSGGKLPQETAKEMMGLSEIGLLIDGGELNEADDTYVLPFYVTGKITDIEDMTRNPSHYKKNAQKRGALRFKKKSGDNPRGFWPLRNRTQNKDEI